MYANEFDTIVRTVCMAFEGAALWSLAVTVTVMVPRLVDSLVGRATPSGGECGPGSAGPNRGGSRAERAHDESLARMSMTLVPTPPVRDADELGRMGLLKPDALASAPDEWERIDAERWLDRLA